MPEQNKKIKPNFQGEKNADEEILKLGRKITDVMPHKIKGLTSDDPEYWGLAAMCTDEMAEIAEKCTTDDYVGTHNI